MAVAGAAMNQKLQLLTRGPVLPATPGGHHNHIQPHTDRCEAPKPGHRSPFPAQQVTHTMEPPVHLVHVGSVRHFLSIPAHNGSCHVPAWCQCDDAGLMNAEGLASATS
jgi:hypothetical protein